MRTIRAGHRTPQAARSKATNVTDGSNVFDGASRWRDTQTWLLRYTDKRQSGFTLLVQGRRGCNATALPCPTCRSAERRWNRVSGLRERAVPKGSALFPYLPLLHCGASCALRARNDRVALLDTKIREVTRSACLPSSKRWAARRLASSSPGRVPQRGGLIAHGR